MSKIITKNIVISLMATAAVELTYKVNNIGILATINIVIFIVSMVVSINENKKNIEKEAMELESKNIEKDKRNSILDEIKNLHNEINTIHKSNNDNFNIFKEEMKKINKGMNLLQEDIKQNRDTIVTEFKSSREQRIEVFEKSVEINNNRYKDIENIINKQISETKILISLLEKNEELLDETVDKIVEELNESKGYLNKINKEIKRAKSDVLDSICENTESNKEVIAQYKEIEGAMLKELNALLDKNKDITELLMSNYKVLNVLMEA